MEKIKIPKIKGYAYKVEEQCKGCSRAYREKLNIKIKVPAFCHDKYIELNNNSNNPITKKENYLTNLTQIQTYFMGKLNFSNEITKQAFYNILNKKLIFHFYCIFNTINIYKTDNELILESTLFAYDPEMINNNEIQCFQKTSIKPKTITSEYYSCNLNDNETIISKLNCNSFFGSWTITTNDNNNNVCTVNSICDVKNIENLFKNCGCYEKLCDPNFLPEFLLKLLYLKLCPQPIIN